jgi:hypothetical protein
VSEKPLTEIEKKAHERAIKFIRMYTSGMHYTEISDAMGWNTMNPKHMVSAFRRRLIARGYEVPSRSTRRHKPFGS